MATGDLKRLIAQLKADLTLFEPDHLRKRIEALDELDAYFGDTASAAHEVEVLASARAIQTRLEAANAAIYQAIRSEVQRGGGSRQQGPLPDTFLRWIEICGKRKETSPRGLGYDCLDELISGVFQLREPVGAPVQPGPEEVFYQPTPVRHILRLIKVSGLSEADFLVDLGSGLGHVPLLTSILTGARSLGIESDAAYVASARECADSLGLGRVTFVQQDARDADLGAGTVFYLYTPFTGTLLQTMLGRLRDESAMRAIRVCTFGPCTLVAARETWLTACETPATDRVACFLANV